MCTARKRNAHETRRRVHWCLTVTYLEPLECVAHARVLHLEDLGGLQPPALRLPPRRVLFVTQTCHAASGARCCLDSMLVRPVLAQFMDGFVGPADRTRTTRATSTTMS